MFWLVIGLHVAEFDCDQCYFIENNKRFSSFLMLGGIGGWWAAVTYAFLGFFDTSKACVDNKLLSRLCAVGIWATQRQRFGKFLEFSWWAQDICSFGRHFIHIWMKLFHSYSRWKSKHKLFVKRFSAFFCRSIVERNMYYVSVAVFLHRLRVMPQGYCSG